MVAIRCNPQEVILPSSTGAKGRMNYNDSSLLFKLVQPEFRIRVRVIN